MKTIGIVILFTIISTLAFAQNQEKTYTVKESQLTAQQKVELQAQQSKENISTWVGVGKEIGTAMREGLSALNTEVNKFSESPAGEFTMFVIAYKVIGNDAFHFVIGFPLLLIGTVVWVFFFYRNCTTHRVVIKKSGNFFNRTKEYKVINDISENTNDDSIQIMSVGYYVGLLIFLLFSSIVLFSGGCGGVH